MTGVLYAMFLIESVLYTFLLTETLATFVGISVLGGLLWPRANRWGALASLLSALATNFILYYLTGQRLDHWDPNVFLAALVVGSLALVVVSLLTTPEPADKIAAFFARLQTSSDGPAETEAVIAAAAAESRARPAAAARQPPAPACGDARTRMARIPRRSRRICRRLGDRRRARRGHGAPSRDVTTGSRDAGVTISGR